MAGYSYLTGSVSASPPGPAVALFQHGYGVEFLDYPQAVVLGAGGEAYRRVDVAEDRAGGETQGDPAPMLLSPDGGYVAVGDHDTDDPDVVIVDLTTGEASSHPLPQGRSVISAAWSNDGQSLAILVSSRPTNPFSGGRIAGDLVLLDLTTDRTEVLVEGSATAAAFSPDGTELAVERSDDGDTTLSVVDLETGSRRDLPADGLLAGAAAWSPDGRLLAITTVKPSGATADVDDPGIPSGLSFVDPSGGGGTTPAPLSLDVFGPGRVLGWSGPDEVVTLLNEPGADPSVGAEHLTLAGVPLDGSDAPHAHADPRRPGLRRRPLPAGERGRRPSPGGRSRRCGPRSVADGVAHHSGRPRRARHLARGVDRGSGRAALQGPAATIRLTSSRSRS